MRKALVTLSGAGIIASLILASCVVKEEGDDDDDGGSSNGGGNTTTKSTNTGNNSTVNTGKGGANTTTVITQGGSTAGTNDPFATGGSSTTGEKEPACPDLLTKLGANTSEVCSTSEMAADYSKINMLIVLDKSGSMTASPDGDQKSKWVGATDALAAALNPNETLVSFGFMLYPYSAPVATTGCDVSSGEAAVNIKVGPALQTVPAINDLMKATTPGGGTPTALALKSAFDYYTTGSGMALEGQKYVLLVTDGGPNCNAALQPACGPATCTANLDRSGSCGAGIANCCDPSMKTPGGVEPVSLCLDDVAVTAQIDALAAAGIKTFVIGIPGTEAYATYLDTFAQHGGVQVTPTAEKPHYYYEVKSSAELATTFQTITTSLVRDCNVELKDPPQDLTKINVAIDCTELPQKLPTGEDNWVYNPAAQSIEIKGARCDVIKTVGVKRVDVVNGCPTIVQL